MHGSADNGHPNSNTFVHGAIDLVAGSLGGCANVIVGQPLDTVKVKLQAFPTLYRNSFDCFRTTLIKDGLFRGLYAGTTPAIAANVAENSVLFCAYGLCQSLVRSVNNGANTCKPLENAFAGFLAAFFSSFTLCPTELIKCKLQALREQGSANGRHSAMMVVRDVVKEYGYIGLFRGLTPTMAREMPGYFFFFGAYELTKNILTGGKPETAGLLGIITAGGVGGISLWTAIFPFDVIKSRIQISNTNLSMLMVMRNIIRYEGARYLYKGFTPTLLRTFPSTGALFVAYEYSKEFMTAGSAYAGLL